MSPSEKEIKGQTFKEPMVVFPLKQYERLMEYIEDIEDRLSIIERDSEPTIPAEELDELFREKFDKN